MSKLLSILIPALESRRSLRAELEYILQQQLKKFDDCELLIEEDNGQLPSGAKRNKLLSQARGQYVCFVDDDDLVSNTYVENLRQGCRRQVDIVSFDILRQSNDRSERVHRFKFGMLHGQRLSNNILGMPTNHLCAWKRELATLVAFQPQLGYNDDVFWYEPLNHSGLVRSSHHIPIVLYIYRWRRELTANQRAIDVARTRDWSRGGVPCYMINGKPAVATQGQFHYHNSDVVQVRIGLDTIKSYVRKHLPKPYHVVHIR